MQILVTILHILVCIGLILVVLLQAGKGANMGAAFGGSSQTIFGTTGAATFLGKMTTVIAIVFMLTSLTLSYTASHRGTTSLMGETRPSPGKAATAPIPKSAGTESPSAQAAPPVQAAPAGTK